MFNTIMSTIVLKSFDNAGNAAIDMFALIGLSLPALIAACIVINFVYRRLIGAFI